MDKAIGNKFYIFYTLKEGGIDVLTSILFKERAFK